MKADYRFTFVLSNGEHRTMLMQYTCYRYALTGASNLVGDIALPIGVTVLSVAVDVVK